MTVRVRFEWVLCLPGSFFCVCVGFRIMFALASFFHGHGSVSLRLERSSVRCWCEIDFADFLRVCLQAFSVRVLLFCLLRCPFWSCVVCASLVVARRNQRVDEGRNRNKCLRRCIANIEVFFSFNDFVVCTWFLAQNWKKAENDLNVFDIGWRPRSRTLCWPSTFLCCTS